MADVGVVPFWPEILVVGRRIYTRCCVCGKVIRVNKWLLGRLHICEAVHG